ncbi:hypothetical protein MPTK1_7g17940 [Marchantia polymorpha subsp. ruderalis]|uniref:G-patch domain-containing protein n=2 Tax=Marchantia polymorpha TaxID=3197 RepID=A0AAF6C0X5_MARPO|nr:hypothetical protein MARPO_0102s0046 [Marchantia polymorpha]BBN17909.1 hypothetical protein Mp_7g17940 [Marchantia polymorpha subsp. ruderalis]|eukprot:PTQ32181.1 hypothetical protein MARPO_0102s0046 [Marchantia polymorpha]
MADSDAGFVLDEASGLYCHAGSGFYHDPNAGWYYNTRDGVYYTFEDGAYIPMSSTNITEGATSESQSSPSKEVLGLVNSNGTEKILPTVEETGSCKSDPKFDSTSNEDCGKVQNDENIDSAQLDPETGFPLANEYPLWYFDTVRSIYWYFDKDSCAYYMYHGEDNCSGTVSRSDQSATGTICPEEQHIEKGHIPYVTRPESVEGLETQQLSHEEENGEEYQPTSGWVEEALIDLYLKGYPQESSVEDDGPWITSADIFTETTENGSYHANVDIVGSSFYDGSSTVKYDDQIWSRNHNYDMQGSQAHFNDSDNDGSEELEEGEWVPDEPLRIVDGEEGEARTLHTDTMDNEVSHGRFPSQTQASSDECDNQYEQSHGSNHENGETGHYDEADDLDMEEGEISLADEISSLDEQKKEEEKWHAQYGQVVREKSRDYMIPGAVDLWDWIILDKESKASKQGKSKKQLVGRIVSSVTRLHPSLSGSSGLIRTSAIKAAELDYVKVSSGKIYRLRRPSRKHVASAGNYDSSNPTKGLGFPALGLAALDTPNENATGDLTVAREPSKGRADSLVSKPFVPNTGHWRFQRLLPTKRKQRYRDRAAERRHLHGGFGVGPGQRGVSVLEEERLEADEAIGMVGALEKAAVAPPIGRENVGKRMLEGMGWKEGQTLGVEGGLVNPLQAQGNVGRAGLGWG